MEPTTGQHRVRLFTWVDYVLLVATLILSMAIGLYQALKGGKQKTTDEYLMADRKMRILPVAVSLAVSFVSGISLLGHPAEIYYYGINYAFYFLGACCGILLGAILYVPLFYPLRMTSINEYLKKRFESKAVVLVGWLCQVLYQVVFIGIVLFAPSVMMEKMAGIPVWASILVTGLVGTVYTAVGGLKAVIWTDVFQAIVIYGGLLTILVKGTYQTGGPGEVWFQYRNGGKTNVEFVPSPFRRQTVFSTFLFAAYFHLAFMAISQTALQRFSAVPSLQAAKRTLLITVLPYFTIQLLCCLCGIVAFSYFAKQGCEPLAAGYITSPNQIVPFFVMEVLYYPGIPGLFFACIMCGSLSNLSSSLNAITALTWSDLMSAKFERLSESRKTTITKIMAVAFGLISLGLSFAFALFRGTISQFATLVLGATSVPMVAVFTLGALVPRLNWKSLLTTVLACVCLTLYFGVGGMTVKAHQAVLSKGVTTGCSSVFTNNTNHTVNTTLDLPHHIRYLELDALSNTTATMETSTDVGSSTDNLQTSGWKKMFQISHFWISPICLLFGSAIGVLATLIPGCSMVSKRTPSLYFRCVGRCIKRKTNGAGYQAVDVIRSDDFGSRDQKATAV